MDELIIEELIEKLEKAMESLGYQLGKIRTGRANPNMLDSVSVIYYDTPTPLNQIAGISVVEGRQLVIKPYDRSSLKDIERGIYEAELGLTPQNDGEIIRIMVPALTEERRKEFAKDVWKEAENCKIKIRNARRDANDETKKSDLSEDEKEGLLADIQKQTDKYVKLVDETAKQKEKDILTV